MRKNWEIKQAVEPNTLELYVYGEIMRDDYRFWGDEEENHNSAEYFAKQLSQYGNISKINIYINSTGGDAFEGTAIYNQLKRHAAEKIVYIDGIAASAASVIAMAGDKIVMPANAMMLIHNAYLAWTSGTASELRKQADALDKINEGGRQAFLQKAGEKLTEDALIEMLDNETWLTAQDCLKYGLADEIPDYMADTEKMAQLLQKNNLALAQSLSYRTHLAKEMKELYKTEQPEVTEVTEVKITQKSLSNILAGFFNSNV